MRSVNSRSPRSGFRQRGAILITSMLLLLVLTILGVTVMQMSRMQERMAGNSRDVNLAFQAAEGVMRSAELHISEQKNRPIACSSTPCEWWQNDASDTPVANAPEDWWKENGETFDQGTIAGVRDAPIAVIEEIGFACDDGCVSLSDPQSGRDFYQITARSTGGSGQAEVVLQSTFTRKF